MSEQNARVLVKLLVTNGVEVDVPVQIAQVQKWATTAGLDSILEEALVSAGDNGWIDHGPIPRTIKLTQNGFMFGSAS